MSVPTMLRITIGVAVAVLAIAPSPVTAPVDAESTEAPVAEAQPAPAPGSTATIVLQPIDEAGTLVVDDLSPHLALEIDTSARSALVDLDAASMGAALAAERVTVELFDGVVADLTTTAVPTEGAPGTEVWVATGGVTDVDAAVVTLLTGGGVIGQFWVDGAQYGVQPVDGRIHVLFEVARSFDNGSEPDAAPGPANGPSGLTGPELGVGGSQDGTGGPTIDVMVAYDDETLAFYGNDVATVEAQAAAMVNLTNAVYLNSQTEQTLALTHVFGTGTTPTTTSIFTYRNQLAAKTDGTFDDVHTSRDANASDLIVLLSNRFVATGFCGLAFFPTGADPAEDNAYNVTEASCAIGGLTFPHELGHNQCAGHDLNSPNPCGYTDGTGHVDAGAGNRTVMARNANTCCVRQPVYSNPDNSFNGWVTGVAGVADNHRVMEIEDLAGVSGGLANYRVAGAVTCDGLPATIIGTPGDDVLVGTAGDDVIVALAGDDQVFGDDGDDTICLGSGADIGSGQAGDDVILGEAGADTVNGGPGADDLRGGDGDDTIGGQAGGDALTGGVGGDLLFGDGGDDDLFGGPGDDVLRGAGGIDRLDGGPDDDDLQAGSDADVDVDGGPGVDLVRGGGGDDRIDGGDGDDTVQGGTGDDTVRGGGGADRVTGNANDDVLSGGAGADELFGGPGFDTVQGDGGADLLRGNDGADVLNGGDDADVLFGDGGNDDLFGGAGDDTLHGGNNADELFGEDGADDLFGNQGGDVLDGGPGAPDDCNGGGGPDTTVGGCETTVNVP